MKDFRFFRGFNEGTIEINLTQTNNGIITHYEYNRRRDIMASHEDYLRRFYELQRLNEERRIEERNRI